MADISTQLSRGARAVVMLLPDRAASVRAGRVAAHVAVWGGGWCIDYAPFVCVFIRSCQACAFWQDYNACQ
jgi:hypothetical protein